MELRLVKKYLATLFMAIFAIWGSAHADIQNVQDSSVYYFPIIYRQSPPEWIGPDGGTIVSVVYAPSSPNVMYAGTWGGGVYRSMDGGSNWEEANNGLGNLLINAMAVDPKNPQVVYAGTYKGKLYKSDNGGDTWTLSSSGIQENAIVYSVVINPDEPNIVYVATRGESNNGGPPWNGVVYKSTNGGKKWVPVLKNVGGSSQKDWAYALCLHPNKPKVIYAATHEHGIYRSMDSGKTWSAVNNGITDLSTRAVVVDPDTKIPATVYTGVWRKTGVFKSIDSGASWKLEANGLKSEQIFRMVIDPLQPSYLYLGTFTHGVIKTRNSGNTWVRSGLRDDQIIALDINPKNSKILFAGTDGNGLFKGTNRGETWNHSQSGLTASWVTSFLVHRDDPSLYFASLFGGGVVKSGDGGETWVDFNQNLGDRYIHALIFHPVNPNIIYALTDQKGMYMCDISTDSCWIKVGENLPSAVTAMPTFGLEHPFAGWRTMVEPLEDIVEDVTTQALGSLNAALLGMEFSQSNPDIVYLGTNNAGVYKSVDSGATWQNVGLAGKTIWDLLVDPLDSNHLYASVDPDGGVWTSNDGGVTWTRIGLDDLIVYALAFAGNEGNGIYAGTNIGFYEFVDGIWEKKGLDKTVVTAIAVDSQRALKIIVGTNHGAYISRDGGITWYPGPDNLIGLKITSVTFDVSNPSIVYFSTTSHGVLKASIP